jgi:putative oxidoreductase
MRKKLQAASDKYLPPHRHKLLTDVGLVLARLAFGSIMMTHGWAKIANFEMYSGKFMSFMGLSPALSLSLAIFAEFFCSILLALGLATRFAALNLGFTMVIAAFVVHGGDPFAKKEMALLYLAAYVLLFLTGPGRFSLDAWLVGKRETSRD